MYYRMGTTSRNAFQRVKRRERFGHALLERNKFRPRCVALYEGWPLCAAIHTYLTPIVHVVHPKLEYYTR